MQKEHPNGRVVTLRRQNAATTSAVRPTPSSQAAAKGAHRPTAGVPAGEDTVKRMAIRRNKEQELLSAQMQSRFPSLELDTLLKQATDQATRASTDLDTAQTDTIRKNVCKVSHALF